MTEHNFRRSLDYEQSATATAFWRGAFSASFGALASVFMTNTETQKRGVDWVVTTEAGRSFTFDTKLRDRAYDEASPDVLLETLSDKERRVPGWIEKESPIDFIGYAWLPSRRYVFLSWPLLRTAWANHKAEWLALAKSRSDGFRLCEAPNRSGDRTWTTVSVAVPLKALRFAMWRAGFATVEEVAPVRLVAS